MGELVALNPGVTAFVALLAALYWRALRVLRGRGVPISKWQQAAWWAGLALLAIALLGPPGVYADRLLVSHMAEHLLIADIAAPLLLVGLRSPVILFMLPRPALVRVARRRRLRAAMRTLRRPPVAIGIYLVVLYGWHFTVPFEAALNSEVVHALQHQSFVAISVLVWWSALEPERRRLPGQLWKIGHIFAARLVSIFLGMALLAARSPYYAGAYGDSAREYGLRPLDDQQLAGGLMMTLDFVIVVFALSLFFWKAAQDADRAEAAERERTAAARPADRPSEVGRRALPPTLRRGPADGPSRPRGSRPLA